MNRLYFGDNLKVLREHVPNESVDLIYLDPPFNSNATYNVLFAEKSGEKSTAQITAFDDTWHWGEDSEATFQEIVTGPHTKLASLVEALRGFLGTNDMMAYLTMMAIRLVELRRVLKPTGSIYLHCDPTASHYLKLVMDAVFGPQRFLSEIVWQRTNARSTTGRWPRIHDVVLMYSRAETFTFRQVLVTVGATKLPHTLVTGTGGRKFQTFELTAPGLTREGESGKPWRGFNPSSMGRHWANTHALMEEWDKLNRIHWPQGGGFPRRLAADPFDVASRATVVGDIWVDIDRINQTAKERLGYPTQKPEALLERIVLASSNEGDLILDPFCGCGTAIAVAEKLGRRWIGIDITHLAIALMRNRLQTAFGATLSPYEVIGDPKDLESAAALAVEDRYQFEWWALGLVDAWPAQDKKKGADSGIDGYISFFDDNSGKAKRIIVQVKSGHIGSREVRELKGTLDREKAAIAVLVALQEPTSPMTTEAVSAGFYDSEHFKGEYPRMQILTIRELLDGAKVRFPLMGIATFKAAPQKQRGEQQELF